MNVEDFTCWSHDLPELENSAEMKKAIGLALISVCTLNDPSEAIQAASQRILVTFKENILPAAAFVAHPANRVSAFSTEADWLAAYMRFLIQKADNLTSLSHEIDAGRVKSVRIVDADDPGVCRGCFGRKTGTMRPEDVSYDDIPPYHFGCRCSILFLK